MSSSFSPTEIENTAILNEIMKPQEIVTIHPNESTESVNIVQVAPLTAQEQIEAREKALKVRALKRLERRERNHQIAEEACRAGDALFDGNDYAGALTCYIDATNLWPSNPEFYLKLTKAYVRCERYVDATHAATRALSFDPTSLEARYYRGVARLEQGLLPAAKIDFETVIAHDPVHVLAHTSLGRTLSLLQATKLGNHLLSPPPSEVTPDGEPVDFAFPRYEDDKLEIAEPSDSSDCNHVGNGVPCRFYNHDGCARGVECDFSHAPDEKSVRDDLGKNVCLYYLLSSCKFGDHKCIYAHSKDALPTTHGWWNDPQQIKRVKEVLELAEKKAKEKRAQDSRRVEGKKTRGKGQGRGKGQRDTSKSKERSGRGKSRDDKSAVKEGETHAVVGKDEKKGNGEVGAVTESVGEPQVTFADDSDKGSASGKDEVKKENEEGTDVAKEGVKEPDASDVTTESGLQTEEHHVEATDPQVSDPAVQGEKTDNEATPGTPSN